MGFWVTRKNPQKTVQVDSEMHNFGGLISIAFCFNVASNAFHKSRKREKGNKATGYDISQLKMATDEYGGGLAAKDCPLFIFCPSWLL